MNETTPPGFDYNPSSWRKRTYLLVLAIIGFLVALYLGLYQLHVFPTVWEPFFGNGTNEVVKSSFSRSLPIPDGLIGAFGYLCDVVLVSIGGKNRWKTKPWEVILYALLVAVMGLVSILLIVAQAFLLHAWCTLCLVSAAVSLSMVIPGMREMQAARHCISAEKKMKHFGAS